MSEGSAVSERSELHRGLYRHLKQTGTVTGVVLANRRPLGVFGTVTVGYLVVFLSLVGDLSVRSGVGYSITVVDQPLSVMTQAAPGAYMHRPVALLELGVAVWEFSPLNTLLGAFLATLVGLNLAVSYLSVVQPRSCGVRSGAGVFASLPALLAGSACCAPVIFLVLGIQAGGVLLTAFTWLLPASVLLLLSTLVYLANKTDMH